MGDLGREEQHKAPHYSEATDAAMFTAAATRGRARAGEVVLRPSGAGQERSDA